jgi:hypothetical protein
VVRSFLTTILPGGGLPPGRLPSSLCRYSARYAEIPNDRNFESSFEPNNAAIIFSNNVSNNFASNASYNAAGNGSRTSRHSSLFSYRRTCGRSSLHSSRHLCRYFPANNARSFEGRNRAFRATRQSACAGHRVAVGFERKTTMTIQVRMTVLSFPNHPFDHPPSPAAAGSVFPFPGSFPLDLTLGQCWTFLGRER